MLKSLKSRSNDLAKSKFQLDYLSNSIFVSGELPTFIEKLKETKQFPIRPKKLEILQINLGYMCNQVCSHCHVDAGPDRKEIMNRAIMEQCLEAIKKSEVHTVDLTGGAPEMNPDFRWFVEEVSKIGVKDIIVRSNLTIFSANKKYHDLPGFFKEHSIHVVSSMPHWTQGKTDNQRGDGVFNKSIKALKALNNIGYGLPESDLQLDLVYNPAGAFLPADQASLEKDFKSALLKDFNIHFNSLFAITNLPISRFLDYLIASENYEDYMLELINAYNSITVKDLMCTNTLSVSWDGWIYDCDFNQILNLKIASKAKHISEFNEELFQDRNIIVSQHCYGCTAGSGSSCQGSMLS